MSYNITVFYLLCSLHNYEVSGVIKTHVFRFGFTFSLSFSQGIHQIASLMTIQNDLRV